MASGYALPPAAPLEIHDSNVAEKWKRFLLAWTNYALATELNKKSGAVQVATLLTVIGEDAREVYSTFTVDEGEINIDKDRARFKEICRLLSATRERTVRKISVQPEDARAR